jgi:DNA invertase Pin-like site-specific DNA recombinase
MRPKRGQRTRKVADDPMAAARPKLVGLVRVSTEKQEESGLGLEGQLAAIERHRSSIDGELIEIYIEVESGKHNDISSRPKLREASDHAIEAGATLVIAKLDRMVRSVSVLVYLRDTGVKFVACDNPHVNEMIIDILVAVAAGEARMISTRTKDALRAYRDGKHTSRRIRALYPDGVPAEVLEATAGKLGAHLPQCRHNLGPAAIAKGRAESILVRQARALKAAQAIGRVIEAIRAEEVGISMEKIAARLNERERKTPRKREWTGKQVARVLARIKTD